MPEGICTHPWKYRVDPFRIAGNLYYVGNTNVSCHLFDTGDGLILLDTAYPQSVYLLLESIRKLGFDPNDIRYVLHTHGHYDHMGGTPAIVGLIDTKTALGKEDVPYVAEPGELSWAPEYEVPFYEAFKPDILLSDGDKITLGSTEIECMHTPGHTPGTISYFTTVLERGQTYTLGIHGGPGLNTLTDNYMKKYGIPASAREDYLASMAKLRSRKVDIFIGAHPSQNDTFAKRDRTTDEKNAFIAPEDWMRFLDGMEGKAREMFG